jgi:cytochrome P450
VTDVDLDLEATAEAQGLMMQLIADPVVKADPYPTYERLRTAFPVFRSVLGPIVISRYDDCLTALRDPRLGRGLNLRPPEGHAMSLSSFQADPARRDQIKEALTTSLLFLDPPEHTRLRGLVSRVFTPQRVERLRAGAEVAVASQLDELAEAGEADVLSVVGFPLPVAVIGDLVGVPEADRARFQGLVRAAASVLEPIVDDATFEAGLTAQAEMRAYFHELLAERRARPQDDLMSALVSARESDDRLTDAEVVSTIILLFAAGFETTRNLIGNGLLALLRHPEEMARWRSDPGLDRTAVDELLRWDSPVQLNTRTALEPAEVAGVPMEVGAAVVILPGAANRDPARFAEPDRFDLGRVDNVPLSFGWGVHHCLGAALARMEGAVAFRGLLDRFDSIEPADDEPAWRNSLTLRGLDELRVRV